MVVADTVTKFLVITLLGEALQHCVDLQHYVGTPSLLCAIGHTN